MSKSNDNCPFEPDLEALQSKIEFEAFKNKEKKEKTLYELWGDAEEAIRKLWGKMDEDEDSFWDMSLHSESIPVDLPRDPKARDLLLRRLDKYAQFKKKAGPRLNKARLLQKEIASIKKEIQEDLFSLRMMKLKGRLSKESGANLLEYISLPRLDKTTAGEWLPVYVNYFKVRHKNEMGNIEIFKGLVREETQKEFWLLEDEEPTMAQYNKNIVKRFKSAFRSFANDQTILPPKKSKKNKPTPEQKS